ncbi:MAG: hypothetical protein JWN44_1314 [Myxococcales bacterium]|nr:hypothetical protein [Myxococcales bacterium]
MIEQTAPTATVTIEPEDHKDKSPREYLIRVTLKGPNVMTIARDALARFAPAGDQPDRRRFDPILAKPIHMPNRDRDAPPKPPAVVGVEATVIWDGRPDEELVAQLRAALLGRCQKASVREMRECGEPECTTTAPVEWNRPQEIPQGWYNASVCGKHSYKECPRCKSLYLMTSTNSGGQAESVSCEVCGSVMIEWGGTKHWEAQLVTRVEP